MLYQLIEQDSQLFTYCESLKSAKHIALDSEFVRTKTFYPHLGLLQIFDGQQIALIDPLQIKHWQPLMDIIADQSVEKYFHACSEDIEVFLVHFNLLPLPVIDSQVFASFLDNPLSSGYAALVKKYLAIDLDKSETRTDWLKRPLSNKQCVYAANDVNYLLPLVEHLKTLLLEKGWLNAAYDECEHIVKRKCNVTKPDEAYLNIKNAWQLSSKQLAYLQKLASWRYDFAKSHDIALNFIVHEELLWKFARYRPQSLAELSALGLKGREIRLYGETLLQILHQQLNPIAPIERVINYPDYKKWVKEIKQIAEAISTKTALSTELLVSRRHIDQYIKWHHQSSSSTKLPLPELLSGWRGELFKYYLS